MHMTPTPTTSSFAGSGIVVSIWIFAVSAASRLAKETLPKSVPAPATKEQLAEAPMPRQLTAATDPGTSPVATVAGSEPKLFSPSVVTSMISRSPPPGWY